MHDAKPVLTLLVLCGVGLGWLGLHWLGMSPKVRSQRLTEIALVEDARMLPPSRLADQGLWLLAHRLVRLQGLSLLLGCSALLGLGEGIALRQRDPQQGMRLRNWTIGLMSGALLPGLVGGLILLPVSWSVSVVAVVGVLWSTLTLFLLSHGRPSIA